MGSRKIAFIVLVLSLGAIAPVLGQTSEKKTTTVFLTSDCNDTVGGNAASALREKIRGSNGYSLAPGPNKGQSGYEIILTCTVVPGYEGHASAISFIFDFVLADGARYSLYPGIGVVGIKGVSDWTDNVFSQFDNWVNSAQNPMH